MYIYIPWFIWNISIPVVLNKAVTSNKNSLYILGINLEYLGIIYSAVNYNISCNVIINTKLGIKYSTNYNFLNKTICNMWFASQNVIPFEEVIVRLIIKYIRNSIIPCSMFQSRAGAHYDILLGFFTPIKLPFSIKTYFFEIILI